MSTGPDYRTHKVMGFNLSGPIEYERVDVFLHINDMPNIHGLILNDYPDAKWIEINKSEIKADFISASFYIEAG